MSQLYIERQPGTSIEPEIWDAFVRASPQGAAWMLHGYASIIAPGWEAWIIRHKSAWVCVVPFLPNRTLGLLRTLQPKFAQHWGPCFIPPTGKHYQDFSLHKEALDLLIEQLRPFRHIIWYCSPNLRYVLPFHWSGFRLSPRITYQVDLTQEIQVLEQHTSSTFRRYVRKGKDLRLSSDTEPAELLRILRRQQAQGHEIIGRNDKDWQGLQDLMEYLRSSQSGVVHSIHNEAGHMEAAALFVTFQDRLIYLLGAYDPSLGSRSAMPVLMWRSMLRGREQGMTLFDFEGSMIPGVERFFRRAGGAPVFYLQIERNQLPLAIRWINALRS